MRLHRSQDGGATWTDLGTHSRATQTNKQYCICHADRTKVFCAGTAASATGVEISVDSGATVAPVPDQGGWVPYVYNNLPSKHLFNSQLTVPGLVRVSDGTYIYKSLDYGVVWARATGHIDLMAAPNIEVVPDATEKLYLHCGSGGGSQAQATEDEGVTVYEKDGAGATALGGNITDLTPIWTLP